VYEKRLPWIQPPREFDCIVNRLVSGMKPVVKGIDNKCVGALYVFPFCVGHRFHVGDVGEGADAMIGVRRVWAVGCRLDVETHDGQFAVHHAYGCDGERADRYWHMWLYVGELDGWHAWIASLGGSETIWDALHEVLCHEVFSMYCDVAEEHTGAYVVDSAHVVEVFVGDEYAVDVWKFGQRYHLFAEVGAAFD